MTAGIATARPGEMPRPALLLALLTLGLAAGCSRPAPTEPAGETAPAESAPGPSPLEVYLSFADALPPDADETRAVALLAEGLEKLAGAVSARGLGGPEINVDLRVAATHLRLAPQSTENAALVRQRLVAAAQALPGRGAQTAVPLARAIDPGRRLPGQYRTVAAVFDACAAVLRGS